jgi:pyruvate formate lyase activating enzyme
MNIAGLQKVSLLDYSGKVACTIFFQGCNFNCGYCYNKTLILSQGESHITEDEVLEYLQERKKLLDAVCLCGGEPTLQDIKPFVRKLKDMGYLVKLDTNGSNPYLLSELIDENLLDYVAMDIKTSELNYNEVIGTEIEIATLTKSMQIIINSGIDYEFRTTVFNGISIDDIFGIAEWLRELSPDKKVKRYSLQQYKNTGNMMFSPVSEDTLNDYASVLKKVCEEVIIKG